jgi:hypothetical protein
MKDGIMRRVILIALLWMSVFAVVHAQSDGQLCVRAFEDRNANGVVDEGEPLLAGGISVNLLDAQNITIASALLDQSPTAAEGVVCFQNLPAGQYSLGITATELKATTPGTITTTISASSIPTVVEFGAQRPAVPTPTPATGLNLLNRNQIVRVAVSALGMLVVIAGMAFLGAIVYLLAFRPSPAPVDPRRTTGSLPTVMADPRQTTGSLRAVRRDPERTPPGGQPPVPPDDDRFPF